MTTNYEFRTVDFRPAPPGWRIAYATADGTRVKPMPGWLIREEVEYDTDTYDVVARTGARDVVAAHLVGSEAERADGHDDFWRVLGPGEPDPTAEEVAAKMARRAERAALPLWCGKCGLDLATIADTQTPAARINPRFRFLDGQRCPACHPDHATRSETADVP